jgi:hypothetical protein
MHQDNEKIDVSQKVHDQEGMSAGTIVDRREKTSILD